jgi:Tol biopolymer transport system component
VGSRLENGRWTIPEAPDWAVYPEDGGDVPFFSPDGSQLYFLSSRPLTPEGPTSDENIWIVDRTANGWGDPYPAPGEINSLPMHWQVSVSNSGAIYVQGNGPDQLGRGDIYRSNLVNGVYSTPVNLGDVINTPGTDTSPYISPDESYLLFASSGHAGSGGSLGIYVSWNDGRGGWTEPVFTGLNGLCPQVTPDGKYLFYRGRGDNGGLRWRSAGFLSDLRPE